MTDNRSEWDKIRDALQASANMGYKRLQGLPQWADEKCRYCGKDVRQWEGGVWRHWDGYADCVDEKHTAEPKEKK